MTTRQAVMTTRPITAEDKSRAVRFMLDRSRVRITPGQARSIVSGWKRRNRS